jgi:hypothetical protein
VHRYISFVLLSVGLTVKLMDTLLNKKNKMNFSSKFNLTVSVIKEAGLI